MAMWRPPERIRHDAKPGRWPSAQEARRSLLFRPVDVGPVTLTSRTWVPAMVPWRATEEGCITENVLDWYRRFAEGRPGAIVVEATGIRDIPSGPLLRIGHDRFLPGLEKLVETVREASGGETRLFIQLIDFLTIRRRPDRERYLREFLEVTDNHRAKLGLEAADEATVRDGLVESGDERLQDILTSREYESLTMGYRQRVTDTELEDIRALPEKLPGLFADAAERARRAGFDGVELHYAHAYTMASFLSALNDRDDGYGGSREKRVRLPLEVYTAVRERTGEDFGVGCRLLAEECIEGGSTISDACYFASRFAAAGMDFLSLSRGGKFEDAKQPKVGAAAYPYTGRSGYECMPSYYSDEKGPFGRNFGPSAAVRSTVRDAGLATPIVAVGGIHNFEQASSVLDDGVGDIVGLARQALADPDWTLKVRAGRGDEVRLCIYTNYCEALDQRHREVTCELWDREDKSEPGVTLSKDGKRRLVAPKWKR